MSILISNLELSQGPPIIQQHPVSDMKLDCLKNCIDDENPQQFEDITAGDYLYERLVDLGLIKK